MEGTEIDVEGSGCGVIQLLYYQETWENHETPSGKYLVTHGIKASTAKINKVTFLS